MAIVTASPIPDRLPRDKRGPPARTEPTERERAIVAAYREFGGLTPVGARFGISGERVRQILNRYETLTKESVPRTGHNLWCARAAKLAESARVTWRCADCGIERRMTASAAKAHACCRHCSGVRLGRQGRKYLTDDLIADTIRRVLAGERFHVLAIEAGYARHASHNLTQAVYLHLLRAGAASTIARMWPRGVPNWLRKKVGEPPAAKDTAT